MTNLDAIKQHEAFKLYDPTTDLFARGGRDLEPRYTRQWSRVGKTWSRLSHLKLALRDKWGQTDDIPAHWEVIRIGDNGVEVLGYARDVVRREPKPKPFRSIDHPPLTLDQMAAKYGMSEKDRARIDQWVKER